MEETIRISVVLFNRFASTLLSTFNEFKRFMAEGKFMSQGEVANLLDSPTILPDSPTIW